MWPGARDTLRLEAGMNLYSQEMDETISPLAANMGWTIAWNRQIVTLSVVKLWKRSVNMAQKNWLVW